MWKRVEHARITKDKNLAQCGCCREKRQTNERITLNKWIYENQLDSS